MTPSPHHLAPAHPAAATAQVPARSAPRRSRTRATSAALGLALVLLSGCDTLDNAFSGIQPGSEGILQDLFTGPTPAEATDMAVDEFDPDRRYRGTNLLANAPFAGEPVYIDLFIINSADTDPSVRMASIRGLANHGDPSHVAILAESLRDPEKIVRLEAARGLQRIHNPIAIEALLIAIKEGDLDADAEPDGTRRSELPRHKPRSAVPSDLDGSGLHVQPSGVAGVEQRDAGHLRRPGRLPLPRLRA
jgi:hypothetical protein